MSRNKREKQYIVVGLGRFGCAIAETLCQDGAEVLGVDRRMDVVEGLRDMLTHTVQMDAMDRDGGMPKVILYTLNPADNAALATLTGSFSESGVQKVKFGPAWWFNDHIYGIRENLEILSNYSLLSQSLGMTTDSRNVLSFSRHEYFRRILCNWLGEKVAAGLFPGDPDLMDNLVKDICYRNANHWIYGQE